MQSLWEQAIVSTLDATDIDFKHSSPCCVMYDFEAQLVNLTPQTSCVHLHGVARGAEQAHLSTGVIWNTEHAALLACGQKTSLHPVAVSGRCQAVLTWRTVQLGNH